MRMIGPQDKYGPRGRLLQRLQKCARRTRVETIGGLDQNDFGASKLRCDEEKIGERSDLTNEDTPLARGLNRRPGRTIRLLRPPLIHLWLQDAKVRMGIICEGTTRGAGAAGFASRPGVGTEYPLCERAGECALPYPWRPREE
jgi:hypothetical protein